MDEKDVILNPTEGAFANPPGGGAKVGLVRCEVLGIDKFSENLLSKIEAGWGQNPSFEIRQKYGGLMKNGRGKRLYRKGGERFSGLNPMKGLVIKIGVPTFQCYDPMSGY